jgi:hypothetical protein
MIMVAAVGYLIASNKKFAYSFSAKIPLLFFLDEFER